jgi:apolipoprotein N-acyltransferase
MIAAFADSIALQWGVRRWAIAWAAGAMSALAMPPFDLVPVLFVTLPVLVWLIDGAISEGDNSGRRSRRSAFVAGWFFGFGFFLAGLWWIGFAFLVEADRFAWMIPFAMLGLPAGLALFYGLAAALARWLWRTDALRVFIFALSFGGAEILRGHLFTGFPWNSLGYAFAASDLTLQGASLLGLDGLSVLAFAIFAAPVLFDGQPGGRFARRVTGGFAVFAIAGLLAYGGWRLSLDIPEPASAVRLRVVQPSIPQAEKWRPDLRLRNFSRLVELSDVATSPEASGAADRDIIIWPESAIPFYYQNEPEAQQAVAGLLRPGSVIVTGLLRYEARPGGGARIFNSVAVLDDTGMIAARYDKVRLVPFGEYLPFQDTLERWGIRQLTDLPGGFAAGEAVTPVRRPGLPSFWPLICYEAIFPGFLPRGADAPRPDFLLNVTNDAWYGDTPGPRQHLRQARMRAVEQGLPMVRAANNGISALIDARGQIVRELPLDDAAVIDGTLPGALPRTPFVLSHGALGYALLMLFALATLRRNIKKNDERILWTGCSAIHNSQPVGGAYVVSIGLCYY